MILLYIVITDISIDFIIVTIMSVMYYVLSLNVSI